MVRALTQGQVFAGYRIERLLGAGGMGEVYLARDRDLPRRVALKLLGRTVSHDPQVRPRFMREADTVARLSHPNIVAVYARGEEDGQLWMAMQYIDGTDLSAILSAGPLPPERAAHMVTEVAKALDHAHDAGVLHRDVKPANILLDGGDRVFLADFGIAKVLDHVGEATRTGQLYASLRYAAPEQFETGTALDRRTDVYALGGTLYHLLTGTPPYPGETAGQLLHGHINLPVPQPSSCRTDLHSAFDTVIARALAKNPEHRFDTCTELAAATRDALSGQPTRTPVPTPTVVHSFSGSGAERTVGDDRSAATTVVVPPRGPNWLRVWGKRALWAFGYLAVAVGFLGVALHYSAWERREIVLAASFAPYLMLAALVGMALLLIARGWRSALVAFGVVLAGIASQLTLFVPDGQATLAIEIPVMQSNLYFGRANPVAVVQAVRDNRIELLTLEELTPEILGRLEAAGLYAELPYRYVESSGGASGSGIFSRHPLANETKLEGFQHNNLRATMIHPQRGPVTVFNFHPVPPQVNFTHWTTEMRRIRNLLAVAEGPAIVGADFNATFDHYAYRQLLTGGFHDAAELAGAGRLASWPNDLGMGPMIGIDRVLVAEGQAEDIRALPIADTDHRAVVARLRL